MSESRSPSTGNASEHTKRFLEILGGSNAATPTPPPPPPPAAVPMGLPDPYPGVSRGAPFARPESPAIFPSYLAYTPADPVPSTTTAAPPTGLDSLQQLLQAAMKGRQTAHAEWHEFLAGTPTPPAALLPGSSVSPKREERSISQLPESDDTASLLASLANALTTPNPPYVEETPTLRNSYSVNSITKTPTAASPFPTLMYPTEENETGTAPSNTYSFQDDVGPFPMSTSSGVLASALGKADARRLSHDPSFASHNGANKNKYSYVSPFNVLDACIDPHAIPTSPSPTSSAAPLQDAEPMARDDDAPMILLDTPVGQGGDESDAPSSPVAAPAQVAKEQPKKRKKKPKKHQNESPTGMPQESHVVERKEASTGPYPSTTKKSGEPSGPSPTAQFASDDSSTTPLLHTENELYFHGFPQDTTASTLPTRTASYILAAETPSPTATTPTNRGATLSASTTTTPSTTSTSQHLSSALTSLILSNSPAAHDARLEPPQFAADLVDPSSLFPVHPAPSHAFAFDTLSLQRQHEALVQFHVDVDQLPSIEFKQLVSDVFRQPVRAQFLEASATAIAYLEGHHLVITLLTTQKTYHFDAAPHVSALVLHTHYLVLVHVDSISVYQLHPRDVRLLYGTRFHSPDSRIVEVRHALVLSPHTLVVQCSVKPGDAEKSDSRDVNAEEYLLVLDLTQLEPPARDDEDSTVLVGPEQPHCRRLDAPLTCLASAGIAHYFVACSEHTVTLWHGLKPSRKFPIDAPVSSLFRLAHTDYFLHLLIGVHGNSAFWVVALSRKSNVPSQILSQLDFHPASFVPAFDGSLLLLHHAHELVVVRMLETQWTSIYRVSCPDLRATALTSSHFLLAFPTHIVEGHLPAQSVFVKTVRPELAPPLHFVAQAAAAAATAQAASKSSGASGQTVSAAAPPKKQQQQQQQLASPVAARDLLLTAAPSASAKKPVAIGPIAAPRAVPIQQPAPPQLPAPSLASPSPKARATSSLPASSAVVRSVGGAPHAAQDAEWIQYVDTKMARLELQIAQQFQEHTRQVTQALDTAMKRWQQGIVETHGLLRQVLDTCAAPSRPFSQPDVTQTMMESLLPMLRKTLQTQFSKTLIPAYEKATQMMFQQLAEMLAPLASDTTDGLMGVWEAALAHPSQLAAQLQQTPHETLATELPALPRTLQLRLLQTLDLACDPATSVRVLQALVPQLCADVNHDPAVAPVLAHCLTQLEQLDRLASFDFQQRQAVWVLCHAMRTVLK